MTTTTQARYEIGSEAFGTVEFAKSFQLAIEAAHRMLDRGGAPVTIFDRMAHKGTPNLHKATLCPGEAHHNPWIDNCLVCAPQWGVIVETLPL